MSDLQKVKYRSRKAVARFYGGIDSDVLYIFFNLDEEQLKRLFKFYADDYGSSAAHYARKTYTKWQAGEVKPIGQTIERLIETLPPLLDFETQCELLRKLRAGTRKRERYDFHLSTNDWIDKVFPIISRVIDKSYKEELSDEVFQRLEWLSGGDLQAAQKILAHSEAQESHNAVALLEDEFEHIKELLRSLPINGKVTHTIELPYGSIHLHFTHINDMEKEEEQSLVQKPRAESLFRPTAEDVLDNALENLDKEQASKLSEFAAKEAIRIAADKKRAEIKLDNSRKDMERFIEDANMMDKASGVRDYSMSGTFESASGSANVQISRQRSKTAIVVAVTSATLVGLILLIYFLSR